MEKWGHDPQRQSAHRFSKPRRAPLDSLSVGDPFESGVYTPELPAQDASVEVDFSVTILRRLAGRLQRIGGTLPSRRKALVMIFAPTALTKGEGTSPTGAPGLTYRIFLYRATHPIPRNTALHAVPACVFGHG